MKQIGFSDTRIELGNRGDLLRNVEKTGRSKRLEQMAGLEHDQSV